MERFARMLCRMGALAAGLALAAGPAAAAVPANFSDVLVTNIGSPTDIAWTPDGRLLITTQGGALRVFQGGSLLGTPALTLPAANLCTNSERGLLGVAVDPEFATNQYIYLFYSFRATGVSCNSTTQVFNRVSRFTLPPSNSVSLGSELVLIDRMPSPAGNHNAGALGFGKDGFLYISIGDGGCDWAGDSGCAGSNDAARDRHVLTGKILRITKTGGIPAGNPFQGAGTGRCNTGSTTPGNHCQETFAWGLRNPFRFNFDPNAVGTRFFINDVGQGVREEIDLGQAGADYGWNCREGSRVNSTSGPCSPTPPGMVDPIFEYSHGARIPGTTSPSNCNSITGGAFVPNGVWPGYDGAYLASDYVCGWIFTLRESGGVYGASDFATNLGGSSAVTLKFNPFNAPEGLYYTTFAGGGQVRRVFYNPGGGNNPPTASFSATPRGGAVPLAVTFDASGSSDPDAGNTLTYFWDFGDGTQLQTTAASLVHTYNAAGTFTATLRVRDNNFAFSSPVTAEIFPGNNPPTVSLVSPAPSDTFAVGQVVTLTASGTDPEDGTLPDSAFTWRVLLHHNNDHTHPYLGPVTGNNLSLTAPAPEDLAAATGSFLEIQLTATDSAGQPSSTVIRNFQPRKVNLSFATQPAGLGVTLNDTFFSTPATVISWENYAITVGAPSQPGPGGTPYQWSSWSDGQAQIHVITTPASPITMTAFFTAAAQAGPYRFWSLPPCRAVDTRNPSGPLGGPALAASQSRTFNLAGVCSIPGTAKALAVNVTAAAPSSGGFLQVYPAGGSAPVTSTLNLLPGRTRANNATVALGTAGGLTVFLSSGADVHFILDVVGYYE